MMKNRLSLKMRSRGPSTVKTSAASSPACSTVPREAHVTHRLHHTIALSVAALALVAAPVVLNGAVPFDTGIHAYAAKGGNGKGNGGGNGNGNGNSGNSNGSQSAGDSGSATVDTSGSDGGVGHGKKKRKNAVVDDAAIEAAALEDEGKKRGNGELGRLNSLKRNINGLMNSNDAKMDGIRAYIIANGALVDAEADLETANTALTDAQTAYAALVASLGVDSYPDTTPAGLQLSLDAVNEALVLDPANPDLLAEQALLTTAISTLGSSTELQNLADATGDVQEATDAVAEAQEAVSPEALFAALESAANKPVTDDVVSWASEQLGVGDADGLIDDYLASR